MAFTVILENRFRVNQPTDSTDWGEAKTHCSRNQNLNRIYSMPLTNRSTLANRRGPTEQVYTYRGGNKIALEKSPDQFVVRAQPDQLEPLAVVDAERVSPGSSRVTTRSGDLETMMTLSRAIAPTHHAYYEAESGKEFLTTDRVLVTFKEPLPPEQVDAFAGKYGLLQRDAYSDREFLFQLTDATGMNPVKLVVLLNESEPLVAAAEHDLNQRMKKTLTLPTDPDYVRQWHLHQRFTHAQVDPRSSSRCEAAWQALDHFGSPAVVVGVTDDGCKLDHGDFNGPGKFAGWGYLQGTTLVKHTDVGAQPSQMYEMGSDHGTSCAGVIAGEVDAELTVGAAPGCRLFPIKWQSDGPFLQISDSKLRTVIDYLADKVDVISNSWGGAPTNLWSLQVVDRIRELGQTGGRRGRGIVFLWAAGNENCPIEHSAAVDVPYTDGLDVVNGSLVWIGVETSRTFRANLVGVPGVMHIAALASNAQRSHYSNYGTGISLCAPTSNVHEYRRLTVQGLGITTTTGQGAGVTNSFGGTSSATPLVAGIAALVISANPQLSAVEVTSILKRTASKDLSMQGYAKTPPASFDPNPTWDVSPIAPFASGAFQNIPDPDGTWSPWFGHGRVDALAAVTAAGAGQEDPTEDASHFSAPSLTIPDNDPVGVRDTITLQETGTVATLKIGIDLEHSFIGDLRVTLIAPSGRTAVLHDRNGGNTKNLRRTFEIGSTPSLAGMVNQPIHGDWTLLVQDLALQDVGILRRWEIEVGMSSATAVELSDTPGMTIPDNVAAGIERTLQCDAQGQVRDVAVSVDITHPFIGDLVVQLQPPGGAPILLHNRVGGGADNIIREYTPTSHPALQALLGQSAQGAWRLKVMDMAQADVGKLNRWSLRIGVEPTTPIAGIRGNGHRATMASSTRVNRRQNQPKSEAKR